MPEDKHPVCSCNYKDPILECTEGLCPLSATRSKKSFERVEDAHAGYTGMCDNEESESDGRGLPLLWQRQLQRRRHHR